MERESIEWLRSFGVEEKNRVGFIFFPEPPIPFLPIWEEMEREKKELYMGGTNLKLFPFFSLNTL